MIIIEPRSPACEADALPLRHRGGDIHVDSDETPIYMYIYYMSPLN